MTGLDQAQLGRNPEWHASRSEPAIHPGRSDHHGALNPARSISGTSVRIARCRAGKAALRLRVNVVADLFGEDGHSVRFGWGTIGAVALGADITVIVDVLSFSTSVAIAVERGIEVLPFEWNDATASEFATAQNAVLAVGRLEGQKSALRLPSLSPASLLSCDPIDRLVLPSPNGSSIAHRLKGRSKVVIGCLRNAAAVAAYLRPELEAGRTVGIVAAGERWAADDSLRPALEDLLGAGAILSALQGPDDGAAMSPEASVAAMAFVGTGSQLSAALDRCVSGRELIERGFGADVEAAAALNISRAVPVLHGAGFTAVG